MSIRHLRIFLAVASTGKMSLAAKKLYISQPTVTQAIHELEAHYGVQLFERLNQRLYITREGEKLYTIAKHVVQSFDDCEQTMMEAGEHATIRLGASVSVGTCLLGELLNVLEEQLVKTEVVVNNTSIIEQLILNGDLDIGIVEGLVAANDIISYSLRKDRLVVIVGRKHPFYGREGISIKELNGLGIIGREEGSSNRNQYEQYLLENGIALKQKWSCTNTEAIKNAVMSSSSDLSILSELIVEKEVKKGDLYIVPVDSVCIERNIQAIYHKDKYVSDTMKDVIELIVKLIA